MRLPRLAAALFLLLSPTPALASGSAFMRADAPARLSSAIASCMVFHGSTCYAGPVLAVPGSILAGVISAGGFNGVAGAGVIFSSATNPASTNAYWNYDGTNLNGNVPTGKGFALAVNGVTQSSISSAGHIDASRFASIGSDNVYFGFSGSAVTANPQVADGAGVVAFILNNSGGSLTSTSEALFEARNNGVKEGWLTPLGTLGLTSGLAIAQGGPLATAQFQVIANGTIVLNGTGDGASTSPYLTSNGTNVVLNVPSGTAEMRLGSDSTSPFIRALNQDLAFNAETLSTKASVGSMDIVANSASVTNETGQINFSHAAGGSGVPTSATAGSGCGTSSAPSISGNDFMGTIGVTCGGAGTAGNNFVTATFAHAYVTNAPACVFIPANTATETALVTSKEINNSTTTTLAVECGTGGTCPTGTLLWTYVCSQQ